MNGYLSSLPEERQHNLTATQAQLEQERDGRIKAFAEKYPDLSAKIDAAISAGIVREVMRTATVTIREPRQFEVIAVEPVAFRQTRQAQGKPTVISHFRVILRDTENDSCWPLVIANALPPSVYGIEDYRSMIEQQLFMQYFENDCRHLTPEKALGDVVVFPTVNGQPVFPKLTKRAIRLLRKELDGEGEVRS